MHVGLHSYQNYHNATDSHNTETLEPPNEIEATVYTQIVKRNTILQVMRIILSNGPLSVETNALLDCGSDTTLLRMDIAKRLNLEGSQQQLTVTSALSKSDKIDSAIVSVNASSSAVKDSSKLSVWLVKNLDTPFKRYDTSELKQKYPHLNGIEFPQLKDLNVTILIGRDHADLLLHREFRVGRDGEPMAVKARLGWLLMGGSKHGKACVIFFIIVLLVPLTKMIINLNKGKTEVMLCGSAQRLKTHGKLLQVVYQGHTINFVTEYLCFSEKVLAERIELRNF